MVFCSPSSGCHLNTIAHFCIRLTLLTRLFSTRLFHFISETITETLQIFIDDNLSYFNPILMLACKYLMLHLQENARKAKPPKTA